MASLGGDVDEENCRPPASDVTSSDGALALTELDRGMVQRLREAKDVREHGGEIVQASATMFEVADEQGSLEISRVDVIGDPKPPSAGPPQITVPKQPQSHQGTPRIPNVNSSTAMGAEAFSEAVHSGQGSDVVRDFYMHWLEEGRELDFLGDEAKFISQSIQAHWQDSDSNAAPNIEKHGIWLHDGAEWAKKLREAADNFASAFDTAKANTPTPGELAAAKYATMAGVLAGPAALVALAVYETMRSKAIEAAANYHTAVDGAVRSVGKPPDAAPLIAKRAAIPGELVKGPGKWAEIVRGSGQWREYEQQVTGYPAGMEYEVDVPGRADPVDFDGFEPDAGSDGLLVEAKGTGYEWMIGPNGEFNPKFGAAQQISNELRGHYEAALSTGVPVEWRVADAKTASAIEAIIEQNSYDDMITVTVVPPA
ncbi:Tox-REase-5 domain-containing protein [Mycolicibacterium arseniciresistens]|uniref:Tox-REase-5 domain-containing protein n=1 Tax=Mycolicibacterium arseniciresistens TaxID=3062257 RepID=A0ABT8U8Z8_9MYCO|nr:Tox-REase-5 domain-containing protein [Mycolicibacterium arseniciresistens]MDO3634264.1 Tox-REase-5 domain-containing protein [Mycolicibacterium arseniciresistens]